MTFGYIGMETARLDIRRRMLLNFRLLSGNAMLHGYYAGRYVRDREDLLANRVVVENMVGVPTPGVELVVGADQFPAEVIGKILRAQAELSIEPAVRHLPPAAWHATIFMVNPFYTMDMAGASVKKEPYRGPNLYRPSLALRYRSVIAETLRGLRPFDVELVGIGASSAAIFTQGYDRGILNSLRSDLLLGLQDEGLDFTDKQPEIVPVTLSRFTGPLRDPRQFVDRLDHLQDREIGMLQVRKIALVGHQGEGEPFDLLDEFKLPV